MTAEDYAPLLSLSACGNASWPMFWGALQRGQPLGQQPPSVPKYVGLVLDLVERNIALRRRLAEAGVPEPDEAD